MVVGCEFIPLEKLNGGLIELDDDDFVEQTKALNVVFSLDYSFCKGRNFIDFALLRHEVRPEGFLAHFHRLDLLNGLSSFQNLLVPPLLHLVLLLDRLKNRLQIQEFEL